MDSDHSLIKAPCEPPPWTSPPSSFTPLHSSCFNHMVFYLFSEHTKLRTFALAVSSAQQTWSPVSTWLTPVYLSHTWSKFTSLEQQVLTTYSKRCPHLHLWHFLTHHAFIVFTSLTFVCNYFIYLPVYSFLVFNPHSQPPSSQAQFFN